MRERVSVELGVKRRGQRERGVWRAAWWTSAFEPRVQSDVSYCRTYFRKWIQNEDGPLDTSAARSMAQNVPLQTGIRTVSERSVTVPGGRLRVKFKVVEFD